MPFGDYEKIEKLGKGSYGEESYLNVHNSKLQIVMTYCDGTDLGKMLKRNKIMNKHLKEASIMNYFVQILLGLNYIHSKNIIHRDIKPENIFLLGNGRLVIGDLGVSKMLDNTYSVANTTTGSPYFMAPELYKQENYDCKADMWSLGVLLYYMTTYHYPFEGMNMCQLYGKIITGKYKPITDYTKIYSKDLEKLINRLLTVQPSHRINSFRLFTYSCVKQHIINLFHDLLAKPSDKMGENTINIKNVLGNYAKDNGMKVNIEEKMDIPIEYDVYVKQLKKMGVLDDIVNSIWKENNSETENKIIQQKLDIEKQKKYVLEQSLAKIKQQKQSKEKKIFERRIIKKQKMKNNLFIDSELATKPPKCSPPTLLLYPNFAGIDIHSKIPNDNNIQANINKNKDVDNDNTIELKEDGWVIPNTDEFENLHEFNEKEKELEEELCKTLTTINDLEKEINCDKSVNENNFFKRRCELMKSEIINEIGLAKYFQMYLYLKLITIINDDYVPVINNPNTIKMLISILDPKDENKINIFYYGKRVCDIICMEHF